MPCSDATTLATFDHRATSKIKPNHVKTQLAAAATAFTPPLSVIAVCQTSRHLPIATYHVVGSTPTLSPSPQVATPPTALLPSFRRHRRPPPSLSDAAVAIVMPQN